MTVTVAPEAAAMMRRSLELAGHDPAAVGVRVRRVGGEVMPRFAPAPQEGDQVIEMDGLRVFVDPRVVEAHPDGVIGVSSEHERLVIR